MQVRIDGADAGLLQSAISAAARSIEDITGRAFDLATSASPRQFRVFGNTAVDVDGEVLLVDDIGDLTDLIVEIGDGTDWTVVTEFSAEPLNALVKQRPVTKLRRDRAHWSGNPQVRVTARWGWPDIPETIRDANRILAERLYVRKDAPFGLITGSHDGEVTRLARTDPDVASMLGPYIRHGA